MAISAAEKAANIRWQAEQDLRTLASAKEIAADKGRMASVKKVANDQMKVLSTVVKAAPVRGGKK